MPPAILEGLFTSPQSHSLDVVVVGVIVGVVVGVVNVVEDDVVVVAGRQNGGKQMHP